MFDLFIKKPFLSTFIMCLLFFITAGIFFENRNIDTLSVNYLIITLLISYSFEQTKNKLFMLLISLVALFLYILLSLPSCILLITEIGILFAFIYHKKENKGYISLGIIYASFLFHLYLIEKTPIDRFQHDLTGIYLYMDLISHNIINVKDFDPWYMYYLFHQPLHFIVLHYMQIFTENIFSSRMVSLEALQYLSLFYVTATTIFFAKIFMMLKFDKIVFYAILLMIAFHPTFILFSFYISDDVPVLFFSTMTFYFLIRWYKTNKSKDIKFAAISFGLGTLSKLSILLSVPAICLLFLVKLIKNKSKREIIIKSISLFIIIAVPLSLVWVIRNHILYDMQFYNVPDTSPMGQNFKYLSLFDRLTDFSLLSKPFMNAPYVSDANILLAVFKTEIFGEWNLAKYSHFIIYPSIALYIINLFLQSTTIVGGIFIIMKKNLAQKAITSFFVLLYYSSILYALKYAMDFPYICSSNYRLFTLLLISEAVILGKIANQNKVYQITLFSISIVYSMLSFVIYTLINN